MEKKLKTCMLYTLMMVVVLSTSRLYCSEVKGVDVTDYGKHYQLLDSVSGSGCFTYLDRELYTYSNCKYERNDFGFLSLFFSPLTNMSFGNFRDPLKLKLGVISHLEISMWKGALADFRFAFPIYNEIDTSLIPYPRLAVVRHLVHYKNVGYITLSGGLFTDNRWGVDIAWDKLSPHKHLQFSADFGWTGYSKFSDSTFKYSSLSRITGRISLAWFMRKYRMKSSLSLGRFLEKDWGGLFEIQRGFRIADIYLYFGYTSKGHNGGAGFVLPLWKRKYPSIKGLKIGPYRYYNWKYSYRSVETPANYYKTGCELDYYLWELHPFIKEKNK